MVGNVDNASFGGLKTDLVIDNSDPGDQLDFVNDGCQIIAYSGECYRLK